MRTLSSDTVSESPETRHVPSVARPPRAIIPSARNGRMIGTLASGYVRCCIRKMDSRDSPKVDGLKAASEAVSISEHVGGFSLGPLLAMTLRRPIQYLAITSMRPSLWASLSCMNERTYASRFFEGGNVTSKTQSSCQPWKTLSLVVTQVENEAD